MAETVIDMLWDVVASGAGGEGELLNLLLSRLERRRHLKTRGAFVVRRASNGYMQLAVTLN